MKSGDWGSEIQQKIEEIAKDLKNSGQAEEFCISAMRRMSHIAPNVISPLNSFVFSEWLEKIPQEILKSIEQIREVTNLFPLSANPELVEEINDHLDTYEINLLENLTPPQITTNILSTLDRQLNLSLYGTQEKPLNPGQIEEWKKSLPDKVEKFRKEKLRLMREYISEHSEKLKEPIGKSGMRGAKYGKIQSWGIVSLSIWKLYLLLLPLYLSPSHLATRKYALYPKDLFEVIAKILRDTYIPDLAEIKYEKIKSVIQYYFYDKLKIPSYKELLIRSASILNEYYDKAILYHIDLTKLKDRKIRKISPKNQSPINELSDITEISCSQCGKRKPREGAKQIEDGFICKDCQRGIKE
jgi:hypothetical protein